MIGTRYEGKEIEGVVLNFAGVSTKFKEGREKKEKKNCHQRET